MKTVYTVFLKGIQTQVEVDFNQLPEESKEYLIANGLKQSLNDSFAGVVSQVEAKALMEKRLEKIKSGTIGTREANPLMVEARALVATILSSPQYKGWSKEQKANARELLLAKPEILAMAQKRLDAMQELSLELGATN